jgi:hypothetical protein
MMKRSCLLLILVLLGRLGCSAQKQADDAGKGSDPTQSFVSPLGLGTGATVAVTQTGPTVTAAIARQMFHPAINFWQVGLSGTANTSGQTTVYSSQQSDAPGFKGRVGLGKSSFIRYRPVYTSTAAEFLAQAWCRDEVNQINKTLPGSGQMKIDSSVRCREAVVMEQGALKVTPPVDEDGKVDQKAQELDQRILKRLQGLPETMGEDERDEVCENTLKNHPDFYQFCPKSAKTQKPWADQQRAYPGLDSYTKDIPSPLQWKAWGNWTPILTSTAYRPVTKGVADLSKKDNWTKLLNTGVGDLAFYYGGKWALGLEGGYGQTVQITQQNICNTTTSGTYTAQQCSMAMVGIPTPKSSWIASTTLQAGSLPVFGKASTLSGGAQILFSYAAPRSGGHTSELAVPFFFSPRTTQMSFVVGIQPVWDWNTDPKVGNKFSVSVFVGARPAISKN